MQPANKPRKPSKANKAQKAQRSRHLSVRLRPGSKEMLEFISARDARSLSWLVEEAVREYVTTLLSAEQIAAITEAAVSANMLANSPTNSFANTSDEDIEEPDNYALISAVTIPVIPAHIDVAEAVEAGQVAEIPEAIVRPEGHTPKMAEDLIPFTVPSLPDLPPPPAFMG